MPPSLIFYLLMQAANAGLPGLQLPDWAISTITLVGETAGSGKIPVLGATALTGRMVMDAIHSINAPAPTALAMRIGPIPYPGGVLHMGCSEVDIYQGAAVKVATMRAMEGIVRFRDGVQIDGHESLRGDILTSEIRERVVGRVRPIKVVEQQNLRTVDENYLCVLIKEGN